MLKDIQLTFFTDTGGNYAEKFAYYKVNKSFSTISDFDNLIQRIIKLIFTERGSNVFSPQSGSTMLYLYNNVNTAKLNQINDAFPMLLEDVKTQILTEQADAELRNISIPDNAYLRNLELLDIIFDEETNSWIIEIVVTTKLSVIKFKIN